MVFWASKTEHPHQTIVLTKTTGQQTGSGHCCLRSSLQNCQFQPNWNEKAYLKWSSSLIISDLNVYFDYSLIIVRVHETVVLKF